MHIMFMYNYDIFSGDAFNGFWSKEIMTNKWIVNLPTADIYT